MRIRLKERKIIADRLNKGISITEIAKELNKARSTIYRELENCQPYDPYKADEVAQQKQFKIKNPNIIAKVKALYDKGTPKTKIARILDLSFVTVNEILKGVDNE